MLQKQSLAKAVGMSVQELQKMMSAEEDMAELQGEIEESNPLKDLIGEDAMTEIDAMLARFQSLSAELGITLLPIVEGLIDFITILTEKFDLATLAAGLLAMKFTFMIGPALASAASAIATAMGVSAAAMPIVGWAIATAAGIAMFAKIKSMMNEAKSMKGNDVISGPTGTQGYGDRVLTTSAGSISLNNKDFGVFGTNLGGSGAAAGGMLSAQELKHDRREERKMELMEKRAKMEEEKLGILKDTADETRNTRILIDD
jgi:hypothetical protein